MFADGRRGERDEDGRTAEDVVVDKLTGPLERVCINTGFGKNGIETRKEEWNRKERLLDDVE